MFQAIKRKLQDVRTLTALCKTAEELARRQGRQKPGSEHFILAALTLPDETARRAFERLGLTESSFVEALSAQRLDALASVGVEASRFGGGRESSLPSPPATALFEAEPSGQDVVKRLADTRHMRAGRSLLGADVLLAVAQEAYTASSRAFRRLGITPERLADASGETIASTMQTRS